MDNLKHPNDKDLLFYSISIFILGILPILVFFAMYISKFGIEYLNYLYVGIISLPSSFSETYPFISNNIR